MVESHITLVQSSFGHLGPEAGRVAASFCRRLLALDPSLRSRLALDPEASGRSLAAVAEAIVSELDHPPMVHAHSRALARQCRRHGLRCEHYAAAGVALLGALHESLGDQFTPELAVAWAHVYTAIAEAMQELALA